MIKRSLYHACAAQTCTCKTEHINTNKLQLSGYIKWKMIISYPAVRLPDTHSLKYTNTHTHLMWVHKPYVQNDTSAQNV